MSSCCGTEPEPPRKQEHEPAGSPTGASCCTAGAGSGEPASSPSSKMQAGDWVSFGLLALLAGLSMNLSLGMNLGDAEGQARVYAHGLLLVTCLLALGLLGRHLIGSALSELFRGRLTTDLLFLLGISGSLALSAHSSFSGSGPVYYEVVLILLAIHRLGRLLLGRAQRPLREALDRLFSQISQVRFLTCCGKEKMVDITEIEPGDAFQVNRGERVPVDGVITRGEAFILETQETGVPYPTRKTAGDSVLAGTTVLDAEIRAEARVAGSHRKLDELRAGVHEVMERKSPLLREADRLSRVFVPVVCAVAVATTVVWYLLGGWGPALLYGLSVVVVACPCAFGLALPLLFRLAVSRLMAGGIVPDSPNFLESLAKVRTVVFDKTGTLAESELTLGEFETHNGNTFETLQALLGAVQGRSLHPVARAFHGWTAAGEHVEVPNVTELPGRGIRARCHYAGHHYILEVGNSLVLPKTPEAETGDPRESTPDYRQVYVLLNGKHAATAQLEEVALPGAARALGELADQGLRVAILTGDDRLPPEFRHPGVEAHTCLTSEQKAEFVEAEEQAGRACLFIGDGLNDLQAMNRATASLAVGKAHELTQFSSRAYWQTPRYEELPELLRFSRHIVRRGRTVAHVALGYNGVGMTLAALGLIHPVIAALLMLASSVTVTTLAARATEAEEPDPTSTGTQAGTAPAAA